MRNDLLPRVFLLIFIAALITLLIEAVRRLPLYVSVAGGLLLLVGVFWLVLREKRMEKSDKERGWRVGHQGRDFMYYEELREGKWERLFIDGDMLTGKAHHVVYFASPEKWKEYPEWARDRREEIIARIKSKFTPPDYEYEGA